MTSPPKSPFPLRRFLIILLPLLSVISTTLIIFFFIDTRLQTNQLKIDELHNIKLEKALIEDELDSALTDLIVHSEHRGISNLSNDSEAVHFKHVAEDLRIFSKLNNVYDQIRFIDIKGQEKVRINYNKGSPYIVPEDLLQDKSSRPYFTHSMRLERDDIYISAFDLNMEQGKIEKPLKPIIRFSTPIFDSTNKKTGILIYNYITTKLTSSIKRISENHHGRPMLINSDSYWLIGLKSGDEWGFLFESRSKKTFKNKFPDTWSRINKHEYGQFKNKEGLFTFATIYPTNRGEKFNRNINTDLSSISETPNYWKLVSYISPKVLYAQKASLAKKLLLLFLLLFLIITPVSLFLAYSMDRRKEYEETQREYEDKLRKLSRAVEQSPASVVITDPDGNIEYVNPNFTLVTGYSQEEAIGRNPSMLKSGRHSKRFYDDLWKTIRSGKTWKGEICNKNKNGGLYWESTSISPIVNSKGEVVNFVSVNQDVTELKKAKEDAEAATKAKSDFLANMSHELRTPLNAILGFSEMLGTEMAGELNDIQKEYLNDVYESGEHLLLLINDILDLSKVESGNMELEISEIKIISLIERCLIFFKEKALGKKLKITTDIKEDIGLIAADELKLKQVLINLIGNAVKFTPEDGEITIHAIKSDKELKITVEDTGIGIDKKDMKKLFEPFQQLDNVYTKKVQGTGLGLALSKKMIEMHGGTISVLSSPGKGSSFTFILPLKENKKTDYSI